jgi:hypothetical protein
MDIVGELKGNLNVSKRKFLEAKNQAKQGFHPLDTGSSYGIFS